MKDATKQVESWLARIRGNRPAAIVLGGSCNALSFARSLGRRGVPVLMLESEPLLGIHTRYARVILLPRVDQSPDVWLQFLEFVGSRLPMPGVILSTSDNHNRFLARNQPDLARHFHFLLPDAQTIERITNKRLQYEVAREAGIATPALHFPESVEQAAQIAIEISYPCLLKPYDSEAARGKLKRKLYLVHSRRELIATYQRITAQGVPLMVQEIIPGPDSSLYGYLAFWDRDGRERAWITKRKVRQFPVDFGNGACQITADAPEVAELSRKLLRAFNYRGLVGVEWKRDARDNSWRLMEINARTVAGNQMAIDAGVDFPWIAYQYLTGKKIQGALAFRRDVLHVNEEWDVQAFLELRRQRRITFPRWIGSISRARSWGIGAWDDPMPLLAGIARSIQINHRATVPILMFHAITEGSSPLCFAPAQFRRAIRLLREHGYNSMRLNELAELLRLGLPLPQKTVVLTFDDGYQNLYENAWPVLHEHGMTATIFLLPKKASHVEMPLLSWPQIDQMHHGGIDFGAHSLTHPNLPKLPDDQIDREMSDSKKLIADKLGADVMSFAYPFGSYDDRCRAIAARHFQCACCDDLALMTTRSDLFALPRVEMHYLRNEKLFDLIFTSAFPWYLRAAIFRAAFAKHWLSNEKSPRMAIRGLGVTTSWSQSASEAAH